MQSEQNHSVSVTLLMWTEWNNLSHTGTTLNHFFYIVSCVCHSGTLQKWWHMKVWFVREAPMKKEMNGDRNSFTKDCMWWLLIFVWSKVVYPTSFPPAIWNALLLQTVHNHNCPSVTVLVLTLQWDHCKYSSNPTSFFKSL